GLGDSLGGRGDPRLRAASRKAGGNVGVPPRRGRAQPQARCVRAMSLPIDNRTSGRPCWAVAVAPDASSRLGTRRASRSLYWRPDASLDPGLRHKSGGPGVFLRVPNVFESNTDGELR